MPLLAKREWESWDWCDEDSITNLASTRICLDGDLGTVLKAYREVWTVIMNWKIIAPSFAHV